MLLQGSGWEDAVTAMACWAFVFSNTISLGSCSQQLHHSPENHLHQQQVRPAKIPPLLAGSLSISDRVRIASGFLCSSHSINVLYVIAADN